MQRARWNCSTWPTRPCTPSRTPHATVWPRQKSASCRLRKTRATMPQWPRSEILDNFEYAPQQVGKFPGLQGVFGERPGLLVVVDGPFVVAARRASVAVREVDRKSVV